MLGFDFTNPHIMIVYEIFSKSGNVKMHELTHGI